MCRRKTATVRNKPPAYVFRNRFHVRSKPVPGGFDGENIARKISSRKGGGFERPNHSSEGTTRPSRKGPDGCAERRGKPAGIACAETPNARKTMKKGA
jgi:hypothetical protein